MVVTFLLLYLDLDLKMFLNTPPWNSDRDPRGGGAHLVISRKMTYFLDFNTLNSKINIVSIAK